MGFAKDAYKRTNEIARKWSASGKRFGYPSADVCARRLVRSGDGFIKKTGGK